jgi:triosephosphate isomerase
VAKKTFLFVANWKMGLTCEQTGRYVKEHVAEMVQLSLMTGKQIVLCPTFPMIKDLCSITGGTPIHIGAQSCSSFPAGPYTGEVSAYQLAELGCQYCIVGHSERRRYCHETDDDIARKLRFCMLAGISPILCIGETERSDDSQATGKILEKQLNLLNDYLLDLEPSVVKTLLIAYEPVWAIGTGLVPDPEYLVTVYSILEILVAQCIPQGFKIQYLYGGSLNEGHIRPFMSIDLLDGFLIGGASLDFQKFKDMISLCV